MLDYLTILKQGSGHVELFSVPDKPKSNLASGHWYLGLKHNLSAKSFYYQYYWTNLLQQLNSNKWYHSNLEIVYDSGCYKTNSDYKLHNAIIPKGSVIKMVDSLEIDSFVYSHWNDYWLRSDTRLRKSFCCIPDPLVVNADTTKTIWNIVFETPRNEILNLQLPILNGFESTRPKADFDGNVKCVQLSKDIGYIKIKQFLNYPAYLNDFKIIESFIDSSNGQFQKLIIDLRGNSGGAPKYWQKIFVERFIKRPQEVIQYGAIKKIAWNNVKKDYYLSRQFTWFDINKGKSEKIFLNDVPLDIKKHNFLNDEDWFLYKNTVSFVPQDTFNFNGEIYFLIDNDCFSATENLAITVKQLKLGKLLGANTAGGAMTICEPWYFELPYSHMILFLEIQLTFNADGSINSINGTEPDIRLDGHKFPTSYPSGFKKEDLIQDDWIEYVINLRDK